MPCSGCCGYGQELSSCWGFDINGQLPVVITVTRLPHLVELRGNTDKRAMNLKVLLLARVMQLLQLGSQQIKVCHLFGVHCNIIYAKTILYALLDNLRVILRVLAMWEVQEELPLKTKQKEVL
ncbi:hypothetical protein NC652_019147 [Populus alba x Populus x berolinensis]|nr:hypothetical protein NC652_019147 [Populus alba x Populus x berolinensis]